VGIESHSRPITAFLTNQDHFQFRRLPFGLKISPNSFQRMMAIAMSGLASDAAFMYIDDIVVVGCSLENHLENLRKVFQRLREVNLKVNPSKCQFLQTKVIFLGHQISDKGIEPDPSKFNVIKNYPVPQNPESR
jgi:Reverse transcriptase (RNA-dependent DNA polymerase)